MEGGREEGTEGGRERGLHLQLEEGTCKRGRRKGTRVGGMGKRKDTVKTCAWDHVGNQ